LASSVFNAGEDDTQQTAAYKGLGAAGINRARESDGAGEPAVTALGDVIPGIGRAGRHLGSHHEHSAVPDEHTKGVCRHAGDVHDHLDCGGGIDHIERGAAFAGGT
jgi:hypothetical protein